MELLDERIRLIDEVIDLGVQCNMKSPLIVLLIAILFLFLLAACGRDTDPEAGMLTGKISIGPICPVEPCGEPASDIYLGRELELLGPGGRPIRVPLKEDGSFTVTLEPNV